MKGDRMELRDTDRQQLDARGISQDEFQRQLEQLRNPPPPTRVLRACAPGDGIRQLDATRRSELSARYRHAAERFGRFVPASGAATRMFRDLSGRDSDACQRFLDRLEDFAFHAELDAAAGGSRDPETLLAALLESEGSGLGYATSPKGLIPFHRYGGADGGEARTAAEEHLREAAELATGAVHFTVPTECADTFRATLESLAGAVGADLGRRFTITTSTQSPSTDTVAATLEGEPFRLADGSLLFRPGGHGALIGNLGSLRMELAFIKNIDNILPTQRRPLVVEWKEALGGLLLELEERVVAILRSCETAGDGPWLTEALDFVADDLGHIAARDLRDRPTEEQRRFLVDRLDRPLRVCGMVPNTGEPGGGPFWVIGDAGPGAPTLQIVEPAQIDRNDPAQEAILEGSTHFSPVDVVCRLRDHRGEPYDLHAFVDPATAFVTEKSLDGEPLRALERPGLWNGAMAHWNSVFVEVPGETFAPVKTVFDLLRPEHQP